MIKVLKRGNYNLIETDSFIKIFILDSIKAFLWKDTVAELFDYSSLILSKTNTLAKGKYFLYDVAAETNLTDTQHWELSLGKRSWQGYLLPAGLPSHKNRIKSVFPTEELITKTFAVKANI